MYQSIDIHVQHIQEKYSIQEEEVHEAIVKFKMGKASDRDNITPEMIKYIGEEGIRK